MTQKQNGSGTAATDFKTLTKCNIETHRLINYEPNFTH